MPSRWLAGTSEEVAALVAKDIALLEAAGRTPTRDDTRCMVFGHLTRLAAWNLRRSWDVNLPTSQKAATFAASVAHIGAPEAIIGAALPAASPGPLFAVSMHDQEDQYAVPF